MSSSDKKPWSQRLMPGASTVSLPSRTAAAAHEYAWGKPRKATEAASKNITSKEKDEAALAEHQEKIMAHLSDMIKANQDKADAAKLAASTGEASHQLPAWDPNAPRRGAAPATRFDTSQAQDKSPLLTLQSPPTLLVQRIAELEGIVGDRDLEVDGLRRENEHLLDMLELAKEYGVPPPDLAPDNGTASENSSPDQWSEEAYYAAHLDRQRAAAKAKADYERRMAAINQPSGYGQPRYPPRIPKASFSGARQYGQPDPAAMFPRTSFRDDRFS